MTTANDTTVVVDPLEDFRNFKVEHKCVDTSFVAQHRPCNIDEFIGNKQQVSEIREWLGGSGGSILLVFGPCGVGKSLLLELFEKEWGGHYTRIPENVQSDEVLKYVQGSETRNIMECFDHVKRPRRMGWLLDDLGSCSTYRQLLESLQMAMKKSNKRILVMCDLRLKKKFTKMSNLQKIQLSRVNKEDLISLVKKVCLVERKRVPHDFYDTLYKGVNGDVRATLQSLEILLKRYNSTNDEKNTPNMFRDQYYLVPDAISNVLDPKTDFSERVRIGETDTYAMAYTIHENCTDFFDDRDTTNWGDVCSVVDSFSDMDIMRSDDTAIPEMVCGVAVPGTILSHYKCKINSFRSYKIISNSNQSIISKNKIESARAKFSPIGFSNIPMHEYLEVAQLYLDKKEHISDLRWFSTRFKKTNKTSKNKANKRINV